MRDWRMATMQSDSLKQRSFCNVYTRNVVCVSKKNLKPFNIRCFLEYFRRAVAQRCPEPRMNNLISLSGQHQGRWKCKWSQSGIGTNQTYSLFRCFWNSKLSSYNEEMQLDPETIERGSLLEVRNEKSKQTQLNATISHRKKLVFHIRFQF